jgi:hypothetical protein
MREKIHREDREGREDFQEKRKREIRFGLP